MNKNRGKYLDWINEEGLLQIGGWAREGLSDKQIAHNMGISYSTFRLWRDKYPEMKSALKMSKAVVDLMVENALFKKAMGYETEEVVQEINGDKKFIKKTKRQVPPDTIACIFWLKNRRPDKWRDKPEFVTTETYESDGLLEALEAQVSDDMTDDSWMIEEENEEG